MTTDSPLIEAVDLYDVANNPSRQVPGHTANYSETWQKQPSVSHDYWQIAGARQDIADARIHWREGGDDKSLDATNDRTQGIVPHLSGQFLNGGGATFIAIPQHTGQSFAMRLIVAIEFTGNSIVGSLTPPYLGSRPHVQMRTTPKKGGLSVVWTFPPSDQTTVYIQERYQTLHGRDLWNFYLGDEAAATREDVAEYDKLRRVMAGQDDDILDIRFTWTTTHNFHWEDPFAFGETDPFYGPYGRFTGGPRGSDDKDRVAPPPQEPTDATLQAAGRGLIRLGQTLAGFADDVWDGIDDAARTTWPLSLATGGTDIALGTWQTLFAEDNPLTNTLVTAVKDNYGAIIVAGSLIKSPSLLLKAPAALAALGKGAAQLDLLPTIDEIRDKSEDWTEEQKNTFDEWEDTAAELTEAFGQLTDQQQRAVIFTKPWLDREKGADDEMDQEALGQD